MHLTPFEVLTALNHAQMRLKRTFTEEEFTSGEVGKLMIAEDFNFEMTVSSLSSLTRVSNFLGFVQLRTRVCSFY